jgi:anthranilate phosphoribosyltransferase
MSDPAPRPPADATFPGWPVVIGAIVSRADLTREVARAAMAEILAGQATPAQIAAFAVALRLKGEATEELGGMLDAMVEAATVVDLPAGQPIIDTCGTGGDGLHSINVSTLAALVVAGAGGKVCKHGNRAASSRCGSADLLEQLGVTIEAGPDVVARCVAGAGVGFCFAPRYHPAARHAGPARREIGVPTAFNVLGPIANPGRVRRQVIGVSDPTMVDRIAAVLAARGTEHALVVHGHDGLDELSTTTATTVVELRHGERRRYEVDATTLGLPAARLDELVGGTPAQNADLARRVLGGERGPHRDIVVLNAAAGLVVAGLAGDLQTGVATAGAAIDSGAAARALDDLVVLSAS